MVSSTGDRGERLVAVESICPWLDDQLVDGACRIPVVGNHGPGCRQEDPQRYRSWLPGATALLARADSAEPRSTHRSCPLGDLGRVVFCLRPGARLDGGP